MGIEGGELLGRFSPVSPILPCVESVSCSIVLGIFSFSMGGASSVVSMISSSEKCRALSIGGCWSGGLMNPFGLSPSLFGSIRLIFSFD
eukprot:14509102-Ditylum_brightwellii.AAC.1